MKKENIHKFLFALVILLLIGFCIRLGADYLKYDDTLTSAPFYVSIIVRSIEFLLPALLLTIGAIIVKRKYGNK